MSTGAARADAPAPTLPSPASGGGKDITTKLGHPKNKTEPASATRHPAGRVHHASRWGSSEVG